MRPYSVWARLALLVAALAGPAVASGEVYENADFGFKLRPPKQWSQMPLKTDEQWQVAKFLSDKSYFWTEKGGGWTWEHKPELTVIAFVSEVVKNKVEVEKKKEDDKDTTTILLRNPYKDYLDYLKRTNSEGGFYVAEERDVEVEKVPVHVYEIKVEKLAQTGPKRIVTWLFKQPDVEFAVQFVVLEDAYPKLKNVIGDTLRSFRLIPRSGAGLPTADAGAIVRVEDTSKLAPKERQEKRKLIEKTAHEKAIKSVPEGWTTFKTKRFLVLAHTDEKYARRVAEQGEAVFAWLEDAFPFVGPEEYVRQPVLRICKDDDEYRSFWSGGWSFYSGDALPEVVSYNDKRGFVTGYAVEQVNWMLVLLWFQERDRELLWAMPSWLDEGLRITIGNARAEKNSGKLEFRADEWGRDDVRELVRKGGATKPRELMRMTAQAFAGGGGEQWWNAGQQAASFVMFLVDGPGAKNAQTKDLLRNYLRNLKQVIVELEAQKKSQGTPPDEKPKTEQEEEEFAKRKREEWRKREQELIDQVFERTFRSWTDKQWKEVEDAYFKTIGGK